VGGRPSVRQSLQTGLATPTDEPRANGQHEQGNHQARADASERSN